LVSLDEEIFGPDVWAAGVWKSELQSAASRTELLQSNESGENKAIGFLTWAVAGDDVEIRKIGILTAKRHLGFASKLLNQTIATATLTGTYSRMLVDVSAVNEAAIGLYLKFGFSELSRRKGYYANGSDALIMALDLASRK
jgi:[ribosomal protein S18]-alanine N-acetyltransferase